MNRADISEEDLAHYGETETDAILTKEDRLEEAEYRLRANFSTDLLVEAFREAEESDLQALNEALKNTDNLPQPIPALEVWALLRDIKDSWIKEHAKFVVEDRE